MRSRKIAVNLNTATAEKIVQYRLDSKFKSIDEVKNVNGIGEKRFEKIKKDLSV